MQQFISGHYSSDLEELIALVEHALYTRPPSPEVLAAREMWNAVCQERGWD